MEINKQIIKALTKSYGEIKYQKDNVYRTELHTLRFYSSEEDRTKNIQTINDIHYHLTGRGLLPNDTLTWLNPPTFVSIYSLSNKNYGD